MKKHFKRFVLTALMLVFVHTSVAMADVTQMQDDETNPTLRWTQYGILPIVSDEFLDFNITYNGFASAMYNLLLYRVDEKYLFNSGMMHIRKYQAEQIFVNAIGQEPPEITDTQSFLTFRTFAEMLNSNIEHFVTDAAVADFKESILNGNIVVRDVSDRSNLIIANVSGAGNVIVVAVQGRHMLLDNIDIDGDIIVVGGNGASNITLNNVSVNEVHLLTTSNLNITGNSQIGKIALTNTSWVSNGGNSLGAIRPNLHITTEDVRVYGHFGIVNIATQRTFSPVSLNFNGHIERVVSDSDVVLIGDVLVDYHNEEQGTKLYFINEQAAQRQNALGQAVEEGINAAMPEMLNELLSALVSIIAQGLMPNLPPNFNFNNIVPPDIFAPDRDPDPIPER